MKKNLGSVLALYPTPATVVGSLRDGKVNWLMVGHLGIIGHDRILISMHKAHFSNKNIIAEKSSPSTSSTRPCCRAPPTSAR